MTFSCDGHCLFGTRRHIELANTFRRSLVWAAPNQTANSYQTVSSNEAFCMRNGSLGRGLWFISSWRDVTKANSNSVRSQCISLQVAAPRLTRSTQIAPRHHPGHSLHMTCTHVCGNHSPVAHWLLPPGWWFCRGGLALLMESVAMQLQPQMRREQAPLLVLRI